MPQLGDDVVADQAFHQVAVETLPAIGEIEPRGLAVDVLLARPIVRTPDLSDRFPHALGNVGDAVEERAQLSLDVFRQRRSRHRDEGERDHRRQHRGGAVRLAFREQGVEELGNEREGEKQPEEGENVTQLGARIARPIGGESRLVGRERLSLGIVARLVELAPRVQPDDRGAHTERHSPLHAVGQHGHSPCDPPHVQWRKVAEYGV